MTSKINKADTLHHTDIDCKAIIEKIREENSKFFSIFIHELRNPLALIDSTIQYIETVHPEAKNFKYWDQLHDLINDMVTMTSDASILNKCYHLNNKDTNLLTLLNDMVECYKPKALQHKLDLKLIIMPGCETYFSSYNCDPDKIRHAISNLIKNAIEATSPGDFIHITIAYLEEDDTFQSRLSIEVSNNGAPIPEDALDKIFLPFMTFKKGGTGIGLALVKKIVELHYGSIQVESSNKLTKFIILLPLQK
ncbi:MAG: HAMP domain-containing histidine kinase [Clostridiales bacterium]|jgi:signal transduction histidine kinase|nr:HAMP domain-containing histidine kinase [Clostridiales bacterium]